MATVITVPNGKPAPPDTPNPTNGKYPDKQFANGFWMASHGVWAWFACSSRGQHLVYDAENKQCNFVDRVYGLDDTIYIRTDSLGNW